MVVISQDGQIESRQIAEGEDRLDMFEFVYFSRADSRLYGRSVNQVRIGLGEKLAEMHLPQTDDPDNILVVPVPDTSIPVAEGYADALGLKHGQAIVKNRYVGRTFLAKDALRQPQLKRKHNIVPERVAGKDLIIIDDSIVRLNTMPRLVKQAQLAGARSVMVLVSSAPIRYPDFYGIDTPRQSELAAANMTVDQIRASMNSDYLGYLSISKMVEATGLPASMFNLSGFNGEYPIGIGHRKNELYTPVSREYMD
jgi:amidophosphoribosyltransferase